MGKYKYIFSKGKDTLIFDTRYEVAKHFGLSLTTLSRHIKAKKYLKYKITVEVRNVKKKKAASIPPLVIVSPSGEKVAFSSAKEAQLATGVASQSMAYYAHRGKQFKGYSFIRTRDTEGCVEMSAEFQRELHDAFETKKKQITDEDIDTRVPIATGHYDEDFGPTICPICHEVIGNNTSVTKHGHTTRATLEHLRKCLEGHEYKIKHSIIYVYN